MVTLYRYILRELLKTFVLALVAMTTLLTIAGGVYNAVKREGVGQPELFAILPMLIPLFMTLTMPMAALFAATIVYGRLAADNELNACRAAGIDLHRLFRPALLLGLFVSLFTLVFTNYVLPDLGRGMRAYFKSNVCRFAEMRLKTTGYIRYQPKESKRSFLLTAKGAESNFAAEALTKHGWNPNHSYLAVQWPTFLQLDENGEVERFTSAESGWLQFDTGADPVEITAVVTNVRDFAVGRHVANVAQQTIGPIPAALPIRPKPAELRLDELLHLREQPWDYAGLANELEGFLSKVERRRFLDHAQRELGSARPLRFVDDANRPVRLYGQIPPTQLLQRIELSNARLELPRAAEDAPSVYTAPVAVVRPLSAADNRLAVRIELEAERDDPVELSHPGSALFSSPRQRSDVTLDGLYVSENLVAPVRAAVPRWLDPNRPLPDDLSTLSEARSELLEDRDEFLREVDSLLHSRFSSGVSSLVTILLGAALGVMFRGNRALSAFALSAIPFAIVMACLIAGRQNAEKAGTELFGAALIWSGVVIVGIANVFVLRLGVRR